MRVFYIYIYVDIQKHVHAKFVDLSIYVLITCLCTYMTCNPNVYRQTFYTHQCVYRYIYIHMYMHMYAYVCICMHMYASYGDWPGVGALAGCRAGLGNQHLPNKQSIECC